uniref:Head-to-tail adaptor n=1 Tax=Mycolicibacterium phage Alyssa1 TaxID=3240801 RepID=A0AB39U280_9CAUD
MTYATAADIAALLARELDSAETTLAERRLAQVERMILRRVPDLADQITAGTIDQADVVDVEAEAVYRVLRNPEGLYSEQDGQYGYQLSREAADNSLRITGGVAL